jgi:CheY-like chemotaxis protein
MSVTGARILLVEDEFLIRLIMADGLTDAGYEVLEASNGAAAVLLLDDPDHVDIVVTDIQMPGSTDGNRVAREAKARHAAIPVVYMTGNESSLTNEISERDVLMRKPVSPSEIVNVVRQLLKTR